MTQPTVLQAAKAPLLPLSAARASLSVPCAQQQHDCGQIVDQGSPVNSRPPAKSGSRIDRTNANSQACAVPAMQAGAIVPANLAASHTRAAIGQPLPHVHSSRLIDSVASKVQFDRNFRTATDQLKANRLPALCRSPQQARNAAPSGPKPTAYLTAEPMHSVHATTASAAATGTAAAAIAVPLQFAMDDESQLELDTDSPITSASPAIQAAYACSPPFPGLKRLCCDDVSELQCCSPSPIKRQKADGGQFSSSEQVESAVMSQQLVTLASDRQHAVAPASLLSSANQADTAVIQKPFLRDGLPVIRPNDSSSRPPVLATSNTIPATAVEHMSADLHNQLYPSTFSLPTAAAIKLTTSAPSTVAPAAPVNFFSSSIVMLKPAQPTGALSRKSAVQQVRLSCIPEQAAAASLVHIEELPSTERSTDPERTQGLMQASGLDIDIDTDDAGKQASNPTSVTLPCDDKNAMQLEHGDKFHTAANRTPSPQVKLVFEADEAPAIKQPLPAVAQQPSSGTCCDAQNDIRIDTSCVGTGLR